MSEAIEEADLVRLLQGGPIGALVLSDTEIAAAYRLKSRGQVKETYSGVAGFLGVPVFSLRERS